ncbi:cytochrome P450 704B1 [Physcomitrium patens]|uniref:Cytochrome P450 n=1 Tax=Physcomitrium patens TaxID=3218 RepID=A0A2K1KFP1_PHYPA|nr:cytochrome P450 704B1-like [Physcomitrium patens]PNR52598.1 hypothetical protein PHYPA_008972 [Physcomitrium patens]|eukprot:XP_024379187.1 cytochrome P450 704B1-like [Physcomitrella patens]
MGDEGATLFGAFKSGNVLPAGVGQQEVWIMAAVSLVVVTASMWLWLLSLRRRPPGPMIWPWLGSMLEIAPQFDTMNDWYLNYFSADVKTFSFGMPGFPSCTKFVATVDPVIVEHILTNVYKYGKGDQLRDRLGDFLGRGIFLADGEDWRRHRKIASTEFSTRKLRGHSASVFRGEGVKLANCLKVAMAADQPVEIQDLFLRMTLDSICKVAFGVEIGSLSPDLPDVQFAKDFDNAQAHISKRVVRPMFKILRALDIGEEHHFRIATNSVHSFAMDVIAKRRKEIAAAHDAGEEYHRDDLLSKFMANLTQDENSYDDKELRDVIISFMLAGRDTTAVTLSWFTYEMCCHPEIADKIYEEGVAVIGKHTVVESAVEHLTHEALGQMHYLHAALSESLRLHPAVPRDGKCVLEEDVLPNGIKVKKGDFVQYVPYSMGRMPFLWGPDALEFKPERWLKDGVYQSVSPYIHSAFQAGPRICLGKDSAYLQLKVTAALITHFFKFHLVPGQEIAYTTTLVMPIKKGLKVTLSPRQ